MDNIEQLTESRCRAYHWPAYWGYNTHWHLADTLFHA